MKARIIQIIPIPARIANVVNRSRVFERSSTDDFADEIFALAQFINPADSSSLVTPALPPASLPPDEKYDPKPPKTDPLEEGAVEDDFEFFFCCSNKSAGGV